MWPANLPGYYVAKAIAPSIVEAEAPATTQPATDRTTDVRHKEQEMWQGQSRMRAISSSPPTHTLPRIHSPSVQGRDAQEEDEVPWAEHIEDAGRCFWSLSHVFQTEFT